MKTLGIVTLTLVGVYIGVYLAGMVAITTLGSKLIVDQPVWQEDITLSQGSTKIFPDVQLQQATSVQSTVGIE